jgi:hypothetical protein
MKSNLIVASLAILLVASAVAQPKSSDNQPLPKVPKTVDEAVLILKKKWLSQKDLDWILRNRQEHVVWTLYRPFGTGVRNEFGLWGDNQALRDSCGDPHPEGCSVVILRRLWESVRSDADFAFVRQLDCQFQLAEAIHINYTGFHKLTTGELIKALQAQVGEQMAKLSAGGKPMCQSALTLEVTGKPDMRCFVAAPYEKKGKNQEKPVSLERALVLFGFRNLFMSSHVPPKIVLNFERKCQFPTPPYLYGSTR